MGLRREIGTHFRWYRSMLVRRMVDFDPLSNLLVCGGPRSGSTWLGELIACTPRSALLFEPLTATQQGPFRDLGFAWDQPIPPDAKWPEARAAFETMLRGKAISDWNIVYSSSSVASFLTARRMVVKCCHANALLSWLVRQFNFRYQPIFLVRHPFAVAASQLECPRWARRAPHFMIPDCRYRELVARHEPFLSRLDTRAEVLIAQWCLSNVEPLESADNDQRWITVFYENLLLAPERQLRRVFDRWGLPLPDKILSRISKPSKTTREATFKRGVEQQLSKWKTAFSPDERRKMTRVLKYFGVLIYDDEGNLPRL